LAIKKIGLIVNPIAGVGGRVGLKGSDGEEVVKKALELGAVPSSPLRAIEALVRLRSIKDTIEIVAPPLDMGETEARESGFSPTVLQMDVSIGRTSAEDTRAAARMMLELAVDIILFAGGDGTARDIFEAVGPKAVVLGIPAGVKIHSAVYAVNPRSAGDLAAMYLRDERVEIRESEVMDVDEEAFRDGRLSARLYGYLRVPYEQNLVQNAKSGSPAADANATEEIAHYIVDTMEKETVYVVGPGTTTRPIVEKLGLKKTLLGVDVIQGSSLLVADASERKILEAISGRSAKIIVSIIGGQGFVFGRGSQQISPEVIRSVGRENIVIISTPAKLAFLGGKPLLVDTGDIQTDKMLGGYHKVVTGYGRRAAYRVKSA